MQTFLCENTFELTAKHLDYKRLGKQRVEAYQILNVLTGRSKGKGWINHPAVRMWKGYENELCDYMNTMIQEWVRRGYNNTMKLYPLPEPYNRRKMDWYNENFVDSHRSNLLRKNYEFYSRYNWNISDDLVYVWPK